MSLKNDVTDIETILLKYVTDLYIETGRPVSSKTLKKKYRLTSSTANIRKVLHNLEEKGYLFKPHISAGRIPSDRGYRRYVDDLTDTRPLGRKVIEEVRNRIDRDWDDLREIMYSTSRVLGKMTNCMGLMMSILHSYGDIGKLRIIPLEGRHALVILFMKSGEERKVFIEFPDRYRPHIIDRAAHLINERIAGYPLEEAHRRMEIFMKEIDGIEREIAMIVASEADYLFDRPFQLQYHFDGFGNLSGIDELDDPRTMQNLLKVMGARRLMLSFMKDRMDNDVMITIGRENLLEELEGFSVITKRFNTADCDGVFGVLGPTRMSYRLVLSLLEMMGQELRLDHRRSGSSEVQL
ncbi:MAG: heat-inducible transcription repressor HrcA [Candidatus Krumholzibacteriota bacterium]|nr:heat-inducible transcription repressor HrcA [Candidatus Krumholzibacteriota bacterium]